MSETATKLLSTIDTTEFGVPTSGAPPRYSWLGTKELPTELPSGITAMGARSYDPQLGRFLQPDPTPGGSADAYAYTYGNPLNETDPTGQWTLNQTSGGATAIGGTSEGTTLTDGTGIAANAITPPPVNTEIETAFQTNPPWDQNTAGTEEYEEYWEEEWIEEEGTEFASYLPGVGGEEGSLIQEGLLYQPLREEGTELGGHDTERAVVLCIKQSEGNGHPCARYILSFGEIASGLEHLGDKIVAGGKLVGRAVVHFIAKHVGISAGDTQNIACAATGAAIGAAGFFTSNPFVVGVGIGTGLSCAFVHVH